MEEFHKKWVPKECLPSDLGGDLPSIADMHLAFRQEMTDLRDHFIAEEQQRNRNSSPAADSKASAAAVTQSFSHLDID